MSIPIRDLNQNVIGAYPDYVWPQDLRRLGMPPAILRIKAKPTKAGKNKNGLDRLYVFDEAGVYTEAAVVEHVL